MREQTTGQRRAFGADSRHAEVARQLRAAQRPVAFLSNGAGDYLMSLPTVRALARLYEGRLSLICGSGARELYFPDVQLRNACEVNIGVKNGSRVFDVDTVLRGIGECDAFISLNPWHSVYVDRLLQAIVPIPSLGFFPGFSLEVPLDFAIHSIDLSFSVASAVDPSLRLRDFATPLILPGSVRRAARAVRDRVPKGYRILAVHTETKPIKRWPQGCFVSLLDLFLKKHKNFVAWVVDFESHGIDAGGQGDRVVPLCGASLPTAFALVEEADAFVGVDSCMLHAADLFRVPGVGLFGDTNPREFGFRYSMHKHVTGRSMEAISVGEVAEALESLIRRILHSRMYT